jgi:hypothetical protein
MYYHGHLRICYIIYFALVTKLFIAELAFAYAGGCVGWWVW